MAWGGLASRFTGLLIGKIRVLTGCEQRAPKAPCLGGLSIGQLKYGSLLHQSKRVRKARKSVWARQNPWSFVTYSLWHPITFVIPYLLEASYLLHPTLKGRGLQESVNSRRCDHWDPSEAASCTRIHVLMGPCPFSFVLVDHSPSLSGVVNWVLTSPDLLIFNSGFSCLFKIEYINFL